MMKSFTFILPALAATTLLTTALPAVHQTAPEPCSKVCRVPQSISKDREAFSKAMVKECTDDDTGEVRFCSKCNGRPNNPRDTLRNCMRLDARSGIIFGVPRGDANVLARMEGVSIFDASVPRGGLIWRGDIKDSLICNAGSDDEKTILLGKIEKTTFAQGIKAIGKGTEKNPNLFFGPRFFISKGSITLAGKMRNNKFGKLEAEGKITIRKTFENNKIKTMIARSGYSIAGTVTGNKFGRANALTPATAPDFESNFDIERIGVRGQFDDTIFIDNEAKLLRTAGSCSAHAGSVVEDNVADKFRGEDKAGCGEIFDF